MYPRVKWILGFSTGLKYKILTRLSFITSTSLSYLLNTHTEKIYRQSWRLLSRSFSPQYLLKITWRTNTITHQPFHPNPLIACHRAFIRYLFWVIISLVIRYYFSHDFFKNQFSRFLQLFIYHKIIRISSFFFEKIISSISICEKKEVYFYFAEMWVSNSFLFEIF